MYTYMSIYIHLNFTIITHDTKYQELIVIIEATQTKGKQINK